MKRTLSLVILFAILTTCFTLTTTFAMAEEFVFVDLTSQFNADWVIKSSDTQVNRPAPNQYLFDLSTEGQEYSNGAIKNNQSFLIPNGDGVPYSVMGNLSAEGNDVIAVTNTNVSIETSGKLGTKMSALIYWPSNRGYYDNTPQSFCNASVKVNYKDGTSEIKKIEVNGNASTDSLVKPCYNVGWGYEYNGSGFTKTGTYLRLYQSSFNVKSDVAVSNLEFIPYVFDSVGGMHGTSYGILALTEAIVPDSEILSEITRLAEIFSSVDENNFSPEHFSDLEKINSYIKEAKLRNLTVDSALEAHISNLVVLAEYPLVADKTNFIDLRPQFNGDWIVKAGEMQENRVSPTQYLYDFATVGQSYSDGVILSGQEFSMKNGGAPTDNVPYKAFGDFSAGGNDVIVVSGNSVEIETSKRPVKKLSAILYMPAIAGYYDNSPQGFNTVNVNVYYKDGTSETSKVQISGSACDDFYLKSRFVTGQALEYKGGTFVKMPSAYARIYSSDIEVKSSVAVEKIEFTPLVISPNLEVRANEYGVIALTEIPYTNDELRNAVASANGINFNNVKLADKSVVKNAAYAADELIKRFEAIPEDFKDLFQLSMIIDKFEEKGENSLVCNFDFNYKNLNLLENSTKVYNYSGNTAPCVLIIAQYGKDNSLLSIQASNQVSLDGIRGSSFDFSSIVNVGADVVSVKAFLWRDLESIVPIDGFIVK